MCIIATFLAMIPQAQHATAWQLAAADMQREHPEMSESIADVPHFIKTVAKRLEKNGHTNDLPRAGRPQKLTDAHCSEALDILLDGNRKRRGAAEEWWGFTSLTHALTESRRMRDILQEAGICKQRLWVRLKECYKRTYNKELKRIAISVKPKLKPMIMEERLAFAKEWLARGTRWLTFAVWIDEKKEWLRTGGTYWCYAPAGTKSFTRSSATTLSKAFKYCYIAAVCAHIGPVFLSSITGTTGKQTNYRVRTSNPLWRHLDPALI
jgi:hypothetical protein